MIGQILDARPELRLQHADRHLGLRLLPRLPRRRRRQRASTRPRPCRWPAAASPSPSWSRSGPRPAPATSARRVYFESIDTPAQPRVRRRLPAALPRGGPDLGRCRVLLRRGPSARPRDPAGRHAGDGRRQRRPAPRRAARRRRAACGSTATTGTAYLTPRIGVSTDGGGLRHHLRGARPGEARPLPRLARGFARRRRRRAQPEARPMTRRPMPELPRPERRHRGAGRRQPGRPGGDARAAGPRGDAPPGRCCRPATRPTSCSSMRTRSIRGATLRFRGGTTALVAVIGHETPSRLQRAYELEPSAFLMKPIRPSGRLHRRLLRRQRAPPAPRDAGAAGGARGAARGPALRRQGHPPAHRGARHRRRGGLPPPAPREHAAAGDRRGARRAARGAAAERPAAAERLTGSVSARGEERR